MNILGLQINNRMDYKTKDRFGKSYWDESAEISILEKAEKQEMRSQMWKNITENSNIDQMHIEISGCGDDGGIERIEFYDEFNTKIKPRYELDKIKIPYFNPLHVSDGYNFDTYLGASELDIPFTGWNADKFQNLLEATDYIKECVEPPLFDELKDVVYIVDTNYSIEDGLIESTTYSLVKKHIDKKYNKQEWLNWGDSAMSQYELEFPNIKRAYNYQKSEWKHPLIDILDSIYSLLPGGWEINEGSNSMISLCNDNHGNLQIDVGHCQNIMQTEETNYTLNSVDSGEMRKMVDEFISNKKIKNNTMNLKTQKHSDAFGELVSKVYNKIYKSEV